MDRPDERTGQRVLRSGRAVLVVSASLVLLVTMPSLAWAAPQSGQEETAQPPTSGNAGNGVLEAGASTPGTVESSTVTGDGVPFNRTVEVKVPRRCWYGAGPTGFEYWDYWRPDGEARMSRTKDDFAAQGLLHQGWESHKDDREGRWYEAECAAHVPGDERNAYYLSHPAVYVEAGATPPPVEEAVDPEVLAQVAFEHMQLPESVIRWNPSLDGSSATVVNLPTFVWVDNAVSQVQVTARVPGVSSTVTATRGVMTLQAPGAETSTCADAGTPYRPGMTSSSCAIEFYRSTSNQPVKEGQTLPTATLTATVAWAATWTSSVDPGTYELETQNITTTAEIPVAEVQTIVTR